jgi:hypothetical protein
MEVRLSINAHFAPPIVDLNEPALDRAEATSSLATFAPEDYRHHLEGSGLTESEQNELLAALWKIMCGFVDLGWNVDAVSLVLGATSPSPQDASRIDADCQPPASPTSGAR